MPYRFVQHYTGGDGCVERVDVAVLRNGERIVAKFFGQAVNPFAFAADDDCKVSVEICIFRGFTVKIVRRSRGRQSALA